MLKKDGILKNGFLFAKYNYYKSPSQTYYFLK